MAFNGPGGAFNFGNVPVKIKSNDQYAKRREAESSQAALNNAYIFGAQEAIDDGFGEVVSAQRHPLYANPNFTAGEAMGGTAGNFAPNYDSAGGVVLTDYANQTGYADAQMSSTIEPQQDPRMLGQNAQARIQGMANGRQFLGYNNRNQTYQA